VIKNITLTQMIESYLRHHLERLAMPRHADRNAAGHDAAAAYIRETLTSFGLTMTPFAFSLGGRARYNWVGSHPRENPKAPLLLIGAHYDSVPDCPGADDNASGIAVLLETARFFMETSRGGGRVHFIAFDCEELDLDGSRAYAAHLKAERQALYGMLSLEMVGFTRMENGTQKYPKPIAAFYPDRGDFIAVVGSFQSLGFFWRTRQAFRDVPTLRCQSLLVPGRGHWISDVRRSDHAPFWDHHLPAVLVTDTSFLRNPYYHTRDDTIDKLDLPFMALVTEAVNGVIRRYSMGL
jgi:hypothetical protein